MCYQKNHYKAICSVHDCSLMREEHMKKNCCENETDDSNDVFDLS